ncbi:theg spermatid protein [Synchiropus splendidus]|uniref:theg spermatid protein n=1 Tax=Synchiropus splendidus TaxID=270530 RepID=UPI00237DFAF1|nr:theg spermatid protein [Synchiropus splendidus]
MTTRTQRLALPKPSLLTHPDRRYLLRPSPVWPVSPRALQAVPSERLCKLAQPKTPAAGWQPELPLLTPLSRATQTAMASPRTCHLAQPKRRQALSDLIPGPEAKPSGTYRASAHTELLASPKLQHPKYRCERSPLWPVSRAARSYTASPRVLELSGPRERKDPSEGQDTAAVSRAALSASPSARIRQLSLPLPRKCSSK